MKPVLKVVAASSSLQLRQELTDKLAIRKIRLAVGRLTAIQTWDLNRKIVLVGANTDQPLCVLPTSFIGLLGNGHQRELPMTWSQMHMAGKSLRPILNCGAFDIVGVSYGTDEEFAVIVDAARLLEHLKQ